MVIVKIHIGKQAAASVLFEANCMPEVFQLNCEMYMHEKLAKNHEFQLNVQLSLNLFLNVFLICLFLSFYHYVFFTVGMIMACDLYRAYQTW